MKSRTKWSTPRGPGGYSCPCCTPGRPRSWKCRDRRTKRRQERARYYEVAEVNREGGEVTLTSRRRNNLRPEPLPKPRNYVKDFAILWGTVPDIRDTDD